MSITQYTIFNDTITKKMYNKRNKIVFFFKSVMHAKTLQKYLKNTYLYQFCPKITLKSFLPSTDLPSVYIIFVRIRTILYGYIIRLLRCK